MVKKCTTVSMLLEGARQVTDAREKADTLNKYFCSQSKVDDRFASLSRGTFFPKKCDFVSNYYNGTRGSRYT